jgi:hypothetical protein
VQAQLICLLCFLQHRRSMNMHMKRPERVAMGKEDWLIGSKRAERGKVRCGHGILRVYRVLSEDGGVSKEVEGPAQ